MNNLNDFYRLFPNRPALAQQTFSPEAMPARATVAPPRPVQAPPRYRQRDFGTGYGRSSGYAKDSYTGHRDTPLVRVL